MSKAKKKITKKIAPAKKASPKTPSKTTNSMSMKTTEIRDLIDFISQTGLNEVDIETKDLKLKVKREPDQKVYKSNTPVMTQLAATQVQTPAPAAPQTPKADSAGSGNLIEIKSPMIGTFYRTANPDSPPFVSVGDTISKGQTLCIIEAMKLFNEIESEVSGTIVKVMVENANPVEYDQVLFLVEPN
jgi:acetyl-CoA carboxylase biotin carboxyl carrier protein